MELTRIKMTGVKDGRSIVGSLGIVRRFMNLPESKISKVIEGEKVEHAGVWYELSKLGTTPQ